MMPAVAVFIREFRGYFETPIASVFMAVFLLFSGIFTFYASHFFEQGNATLEGFFEGQSWLYLFLMPALSMRLWAEERRSGTFELLMTLPAGIWQLVGGKFMAAWCFAMLSLALTFPIWITVNYLGSPDNGVILCGYMASGLVAASFLALGGFVSAMCRNQVVAFIISAALCFFWMLSGFPMITGLFESLYVPQVVMDMLTHFSIVTNFLDMSKGLISLRQAIYFSSFIALWLYLTVLAVAWRRR